MHGDEHFVTLERGSQLHASLATSLTLIPYHKLRKSPGERHCISYGMAINGGSLLNEHHSGECCFTVL